MPLTTERIAKDLSTLSPRPNLVDYEAERRAFTWDAVRGELDGLPGGARNMAHEAVDRHVAAGRGERPAITHIGKDGTTRTFTYGDLKVATDRFAGLLEGLGVAKGDRLFALAGRVPDLYVAALGTLKHGAVFCPLFSSFGPEPVRQRMAKGKGRVLLTTARQYARKIAPQRDQLPDLEHVLILDAAGEPPADSLDLAAELARATPAAGAAATDPEDMALLHFTSGTTGTPKGAIHVHEAVVHHYASAKYALDLHPEDVFWCTADPGWVTGTSYGILAPLVHGVRMVVDEGEFDANRWYDILREQGVTVWYTAPTAVRRLMRAGGAEVALPDLRFIASVGEPLNPEAVRWAVEALGLPIHDNWWQSETGGIMLANFAAMEIRPGSMGRPLPGIEAAIVRRTEDGGVAEVTAPDTEGELALRPGWPSMFRGYLDQEDRYRQSFADSWYLSGDLAERDADGYFWFVGRADDVIKSSGHLIGPFEVESVLMEHPAVAEVGVIGVPDEIAGERIKAFVALKAGHEPGDDLTRELMALARKRLGAAVAPKEYAYTDALPKTRSGKIMRRLLKARELGLAEGDTSTLEEG